MSRAVEAAKPVAENLAQGVGGRYHENDLTKLVPWLSITITMQEFISQPETSVIQSEERQTLKETNLPPPDWTIWIGYYGGIEWHPINHARYSATLGNRLTTSAGIYPPFPSQRIQVATFTLLHLAVHAFNATAIGLVSEYRQFVKDMKWNLFQIWPTVPVGLTWPRFPILDAEMHEFVTRFGHDRNGHRDMDFQLGR